MSDQLLLQVFADRVFKALRPRRLANRQRRSQCAGLGPVPGVPAREDRLQFTQRLLQAIHAGLVGELDVNQVALGVPMAFAQRRQFLAGTVDFNSINRRRLQRQQPGLAAPSARAEVEHHHALGVVPFAQVHSFDAPRIAHVRQAPQALRLVNVTEGDVGKRRRQVVAGEDDIFLFGDAEERGQLAPLHVDVGRQHGRQRGIEPGMLLKRLQGRHVGGLERPILLVEATVALGGRVLQVARRRRIGHEDELHLRVAGPLANAQQGRISCKVEPAGGHALA